MKLDKLERLLSEATPGPWEAHPMGFNVSEDGLIVEPVNAEVHPYADVVAKMGGLGMPRTARQVWTDARFMCAVVNAARALIGVARAADNGEWHSSEDCQVEGRAAECAMCQALADLEAA
jgi:hypothetical protein